MKVAIVGGGASGLVAAITAARNGADVTILERNSDCGKKLLITGNGKCNYWNLDQDLSHYHSENLNCLKQLFTEENKQKVDDFFTSLGIVPMIKNGYYYPYSNQATSIKSALLKAIELFNVKVIHNFYVEEIKKEKESFCINPKKENLLFDKVILSTGSKACPKTGSDGNGYTLAASFHHSIVLVLPSLVQLKGNGNYFKDWDGVRINVSLTLFVDGILEKEEMGEIQLTNYGISGICTFNVSGAVSKALSRGKKVVIKINFCPFLPKEDFLSWFSKRNEGLGLETIEDLLEGFLNYKLIHVILKQVGFTKNKKWSELSLDEAKYLSRWITEFSIEITDTNGFEKAQVCSGGVSLEEVNLNTMESLKEKGLYMTGELLDVDGDCGGYNLGFAWISGMIAGNGVVQDD